MKYKLTFALVASLTSTAFAAFQAPLPEFKNEKQLAEWRAEKASESASKAYAVEETAFYTGKPYLASSSSYAFKYRSYNPEAARWTSEDPSGFPDGANGNIYVPIPTSSLDFAGLWKVKMVSSGNISDKVYEWSNIVGGLDTKGTLTSNTASGTSATSISLSGIATSKYPGLTSYTISQQYEVKVTDNGKVYITVAGASDATKGAGGLSIAIGGAENNVEDGVLTFNYNVSGAYLKAGVNSASASVLGFGGGFGWTSGAHVIGGLVGLEFHAVE
ncbi:MAG: RHS repeat-associated core domain-containing protein [Luteolibacter sp.]